MSALSALPSDNRDFVAWKFVLRQQIAHFHLDEIEKLGIIHHVDLIQENDDGRHANLSRQQDVLARLGHRAVSSGDNENGAVHLSCASNHVLHVVGVTRAIDVSIVTFFAGILYVRRVDGDSTLFFFRRIIDLVVFAHFGHALFGENLGDCCRERGFPVVNVTDGADVHVRLVAFESFLSHIVFFLPL